MVLFSVPDIRLFWSGDQRFLSQVRGEVCRKYREGEEVNSREEKCGRF